jgi:hypothetical protein
LQKNIAIGVSLPFGVCGTDQLFNQTYSTKDQTKSNLINLLLTNKGERILNPEFGSDLKISHLSKTRCDNYGTACPLARDAANL